LTRHRRIIPEHLPRRGTSRDSMWNHRDR
jgi:hypothetical protein